ncbi:MAG: porin family protein [Candidatus Zixiibacteriota bacterium]
MKIAHVTIMVVLCVVVLCGSVHAKEKSTYGMRLGVNFATIDGDVEEYVGNPSTRNCLSFGGFACMHQAGNLYLQPELLYASKGATAAVSNSSDVTLELTYIEIPFLVKYKFRNHQKIGFNLAAGPAIDLLMSAEIGSSDVKSNTTKFDGTIIGSAEFTIASGTGYFVFEGRYLYGLSTIDDTSYDLNVKNRVFSISIGYAFGG